MLTTLRDSYSLHEYDKTISLAETTVRENYRRFNFEGQFEDVEPSRLYENLSHYPARNAVSYYLNLSDNRQENIAHAKEYIRFAEDQFVVWEQPIPRPNIEEEWTWHSDKWITPCALEQYTCYTLQLMPVRLRSYRHSIRCMKLPEMNFTWPRRFLWQTQ